MGIEFSLFASMELIIFSPLLLCYSNGLKIYLIRVNQFLESIGETPINWQIPNI